MFRQVDRINELVHHVMKKATSLTILKGCGSRDVSICIRYKSTSVTISGQTCNECLDHLVMDSAPEKLKPIEDHLKRVIATFFCDCAQDRIRVEIPRPPEGEVELDFIPVTIERLEAQTLRLPRKE